MHINIGEDCAIWNIEIYTVNNGTKLMKTSAILKTLRKYEKN